MPAHDDLKNILKVMDLGGCLSLSIDVSVFMGWAVLSGRR